MVSHHPIYQTLRSGGVSQVSIQSFPSPRLVAEEHSLSYYLPNSWRENNWIHTFCKGISAMWNAIIPGFELESPCPFPTTLTITPRAPPDGLMSYQDTRDGGAGSYPSAEMRLVYCIARLQPEPTGISQLILRQVVLKRQADQ